MRRVIFFLLLINCNTAFTQEKVRLDYIRGDNDFVYTEASIDQLIHPEKYKAIFFGESHTLYFEPLFKLHLIKHLNEKYGVHDVFMEIGYGAAYLFNNYLATGDERLIQFKVTYTSKNYMVLWRGLYQYNQTLPAGKKIRIHGVDFETKEIYAALSLIKPKNKAMPESLRGIYDKISACMQDSTTPSYGNKLARNIEEINTVFQAHREELSAYLGSNISLVDNIMSNNTQTNSVHQRDNSMYPNIQKAIKEYSIDKFIGFFGSDHIKYENATALPVQLKKDPGYSDKVVTIMSVYYNAYSIYTQSVLDFVGCIGSEKSKRGRELKEKYFADNCRAVLLPTKNIDDEYLHAAADFFLFANDKTIE